MKTSGYVRLYRKSQNNPIWTQLAPAVFKVACYCIMNAEWKSTVWFDGASEVEVPVGSLIRSYRDIAGDCHLTLQQVWKAFKHLDRIQITSRGTLKAPGRQHEVAIIHVLNYSEYQQVADVTENGTKPVDNAKDNTTTTRRATRRERESPKTDQKIAKSQKINVSGLLFDPLLKEEDLKTTPTDITTSTARGNPGWPSWKWDAWRELFNADPIRQKSSGAKDDFGRRVLSEEDAQWLIEAHARSNRKDLDPKSVFSGGFNGWLKAALDAREMGMTAEKFVGADVLRNTVPTNQPRPLTFGEIKEQRQQAAFEDQMVAYMERDSR